ncbi:MAG: hypothetical protein F4Y03_11345 [Alphaproteobacteria bacterium]|nr:hypothetical protein [Alphaproteobacteria bacterium]
MKHTPALRTVVNPQPELPGSRCEPPSTFLEAVKRTVVGDGRLKLWYVFLASYCKLLKASSTGSCALYLETLARDSEYGEREVWRLNRRLKALGLLTTRRTGRYLVFRLTVATGPIGQLRPDLLVNSKEQEENRPSRGRFSSPPKDTRARGREIAAVAAAPLRSSAVPDADATAAFLADQRRRRAELAR